MDGCLTWPPRGPINVSACQQSVQLRDKSLRFLCRFRAWCCTSQGSCRQISVELCTSNQKVHALNNVGSNA